MTMLKKYARAGFFALAVAVQLAVVVSLLAHGAFVRHSGQTVRFACTVSDPFTPFKGRYAQLSIPALSSVPVRELDAGTFADFAGKAAPGSAHAYAVLAPDAGGTGLWHVAGLRKRRPAGGTCMKVRAEWHRAETFTTPGEAERVFLTVPVTEYYLQENHAVYIDRNSVHDDAFHDMVLELYVARSGTMVQKALLVSGQAGSGEPEPIEAYIARKLAAR